MAEKRTFVRNDWTCSEDGEPSGRPVTNVPEQPPDQGSIYMRIIDQNKLEYSIGGVTLWITVRQERNLPKLIGDIQQKGYFQLPSGKLQREQDALLIGSEYAIEAGNSKLLDQMQQEGTSFRWPPKQDEVQYPQTPMPQPKPVSGPKPPQTKDQPLPKQSTVPDAHDFSKGTTNETPLEIPPTYNASDAEALRRKMDIGASSRLLNVIGDREIEQLANDAPLVPPPLVPNPNTTNTDGSSQRLRKMLDDQKVSDGDEHLPLL